MTSRATIKSRLERAGYTHVAGWLPAEYARGVQAMVKLHREPVAAIVAEEPLPRGWPRGKSRKLNAIADERKDGPFVEVKLRDL